MVRKRPTTFRETQMMQTTTQKEHEMLTLTNTARRAVNTEVLKMLATRSLTQKLYFWRSISQMHAT